MNTKRNTQPMQAAAAPDGKEGCPMDLWPVEHAYMISLFVATLANNTTLPMEQIGVLAHTYCKGCVTMQTDREAVVGAAEIFAASRDVHDFLGSVLTAQATLRKRGLCTNQRAAGGAKTLH